MAVRNTATSTDTCNLEWPKGARYSLIIHEVLVAMGFFPAGVQDETLKED